MKIRKNRKLLQTIVTLMLLAAVVMGCSREGNMNYTEISAKEAKEIMDKQTDYVILDVRTTSEYNAGHIEGAILIPDYEISSKAEDVLKDKDKLILVYCRSGRRSKNAAKELVKLGYTNIKEFGGIIDWSYETVK